MKTTNLIPLLLGCALLILGLAQCMSDPTSSGGDLTITNCDGGADAGCPSGTGGSTGVIKGGGW